MLALLLLVGCVDVTPCAETCGRLYDADKCNIQSPGSTTEELLETCKEACQTGWQNNGEVTEGYDPYEYTPASVSVSLETRGDVQLWSECVDETTCEFLESGYCAPVW